MSLFIYFLYKIKLTYLLLQPLINYLKQNPEIYFEDISDGGESIETTSTDRHRFADQVVNMSLHQRKYNSDLLPKFTDSEIEKRLPQKVQLQPQVIQEY